MIEEEIAPRAVRRNPHNYSNLELARRDKEVSEAMKAFPNLPPKWIEWMWDTVENKPKDEMEKIINESLWDKPLKEREMGGVLKGAMEVIPYKEDLGENES
jgi:NADH:ubiquinone oxidoreductase subunit